MPAFPVKSSDRYTIVVTLVVLLLVSMDGLKGGSCTIIGRTPFNCSKGVNGVEVHPSAQRAMSPLIAPSESALNTVFTDSDFRRNFVAIDCTGGWSSSNDDDSKSPQRSTVKRVLLKVFRGTRSDDEDELSLVPKV